MGGIDATILLEKMTVIRSFMGRGCDGPGELSRSAETLRRSRSKRRCASWSGQVKGFARFSSLSSYFLNR